MARFRFSLESLLRLRRLEEDRAKAALAAALRTYRLKEGEIAALVARREEAKARSRGLTTGSLDLEEVLRTRRFINVLFQRIAEKREELKGLRPPVEEARAAHRRSATRRRAVEKLRERRQLEFRREEERQERRELDEIGQTGSVRARAAETRTEARAER